MQEGSNLIKWQIYWNTFSEKCCRAKIFACLVKCPIPFNQRNARYYVCQGCVSRKATNYPRWLYSSRVCIYVNTTYKLLAALLRGYLKHLATKDLEEMYLLLNHSIFSSVKVTLLLYYLGNGTKWIRNWKTKRKFISIHTTEI